jgi:hypothetical protein
MKDLFTLLFISFLVPACTQVMETKGIHQGTQQGTNAIQVNGQLIIDTSGTTIGKRFNVPEGYERLEAVSQQFSYYLRNLPLKPAGSLVKLYDGREKNSFTVYDAVVDLPIGKRDLHQCADAVMRLRAEYLWKEKRYSEIHFNYTNGFKAEYSKWMAGQRIVVDGNKTFYKASAAPSNTSKDLWNYLEQVFTYCGTLSLSKELKPVDIKNIEAGDVFIKGGSPGHAVIVVDVAKNKESGEKIFLLAQSYMPAQEIQVLKNPNDSSIGPWYSENFGEVLYTPEWTFKKRELMRF